MGIFNSSPQCGSQLLSVGDAIDKLKAFNAVYEANKATSSSANCGDPNDAAAWRALVHDGVINCGGEPMELDFFENVFGGQEVESIDAKRIYFRYNCDIDQNVYAQDPVTAGGAGQTATFTLLKSNHSGSGKYSYPAVGYSLYIYEDRQWAVITAKDPTTDYGHTITARPNNTTYTLKIRKQKKMLVLPVRIVGGLSCAVPMSSYQAPGYTNYIRPFRIRVDWELPVDLMRGYEDILQFAIMFDENGQEVDCYEAYEKTKARVNMKWAKNLLFFLGQKITNTNLLSSVPNTNVITADYSGFDGYFPTLNYGGGTIMDFDPGVGFDIKADFNAIILRNDSLKRTTEFVVLHAKPFKMGLIDNANNHFKENAGSCTFETFRRMRKEDIEKLGVSSYSYVGHSLHFKEVSALSDSRGVGNDTFPHLGMFIPGNGLRDSKGKKVPAIQYFMPKGCAESGMREEHDWDQRKINGCEKIGGYMAETVMMAIHCPNQHILANPVFSC